MIYECIIGALTCPGVRDNFPEEVTIQLRSGGENGVLNAEGDDPSGRGNSRCKGSEAGGSMAPLKNFKKASVGCACGRSACAYGLR